MKIIIQSLNFYPDLTGIGKYSAEMALWLVERGHSVTVITAPPYYPAWRIDSKFRKYWWSREYWREINVWRCPIWVPLKPTAITRIAHLLSFAISSAPIIFAQILNRPDLIITIEPPIFSAPAAWVVSRICNAKAVLYIQDLEIDAAFNLNILSGSKRIKGYIFSIEQFILLRFDLIVSISRRMLNKISQKGVPDSRSFLLYNWASAEHPICNVDYRRALMIPSDSIIALYSGNMGEKQGLNLLSDLVKLNLAHQHNSFGKEIHFIFCGDGPGKAGLLKTCSEYKNVHFLPLQPSEGLPVFLSTADIHLLPQKSEVSDLVMPSKLTGILFSSKPVLTCAIEGSELFEIVKNCGIVVSPGDSMAFYNAFIMLANDQELRERLGLLGRQYALKNLDKDKILSSFELQLKKLISQEKIRGN